jgi:hypothetical protein
MKLVVSDIAVREYIREMITTPGMGWQSTGDLSTAPVGVSPVVDPSAAETDPGNPNFRPKNRMELRSALSTLIDSISDDDAESFYSAVTDVVEDMKEEDKEMNKDKKVEETIRLAVRKMLREASYNDLASAGLAGSIGSGVRAGYQECEDCEGEGIMPDGKDCKACKGTGAIKSTKRGYTMASDEEATFEEIAKELGYAGVPGARQAVQRALEKAKFVMTMDSDEAEILTLTAMNDYIDFLRKSGELTSADVQLMKDHPNIVAGLDGFREFLDKSLSKARKSGQKVIDPLE